MRVVWHRPRNASAPRNDRIFHELPADDYSFLPMWRSGGKLCGWSTITTTTTTTGTSAATPATTAIISLSRQMAHKQSRWTTARGWAKATGAPLVNQPSGSMIYKKGEGWGRRKRELLSLVRQNARPRDPREIYSTRRIYLSRTRSEFVKRRANNNGRGCWLLRINSSSVSLPRLKTGGIGGGLWRLGYIVY